MHKDEYIQELINGLNMGLIAIEHLVDKVQNVSLKDVMEKQSREYQKLLNKVHEYYPDIDDDHIKHKMMLESMVEIKGIMSDDMKIAKMLSEGSFQAVLTMKHCLNKMNNQDEKFLELIDEFQDISKKYIEKLREYL